MRGLFNFIGIAAELMLVSLIFLYLGTRVWLYTRLDNVVNDLKYQEYVDELKSAPTLPNEVFEAYSKIHGYDEKSTTNELLTYIPLSIFEKKKRYSCPCVDVNYRFVYNTFDRWTVGLHLDEDVGSKKCLEYRLHHFDFLCNQLGIRNASKFFFRKSLEQLTEREMLELCLMTKNPYLYNPMTHPDRADKKLSELLLEQ